MKVGNLLSGRLRKAVQSDLRTNVRPIDIADPFDQQNVGAHFETVPDLSDKTSPEESRFLTELGDVTQLKFYMHVNRYTIWNTKNGYAEDRLNGDVYGYIGLAEPISDNNGIRIKGRRLVAHPDLNNDESKKVAHIFLGTTPLARNTDIDGTYDICRANNLLMLRYLDFVPLLDRDYNTPTSKGIVKEFLVYFTDRHSRQHIAVGSFKGDHHEMKRSGGIVVFKLPSGVLTRDELMLHIDVLIYNDMRVPLMIESEWDLVLEGHRGITIGSRQTADVVGRVYYLNRPAPNCSVRLLVQPSGEMVFLKKKKNRRSPIVARWKDETDELTSGPDGKVRATVEAIDLENSPKIYDPVKKKYVKGDLEWDRYYGNYVYLEISNDLRRFQNNHVEQIEIPVRVLHSIETTGSVTVKEISFEDIIFPKLLKYYVRYFPWLHTIETGETYTQFLNLESYDDVSGNIGEIIRRLSLNDDEWDKMPRSRDFPVGGVDLIIEWLTRGMPKQISK